MGLAFLIIVIFTIFQRIYELKISNEHIDLAKRNGGFVVKETNYLFMVSLHTTWLIILLYFAINQFNSNLNSLPSFNNLIGYYLFLFGQCLRISAIKTLGKRWSTRIMIWPKEKAIKSGLYNIVRHPNYVGVALEIFALPLIGNLLNVAWVFSLLNGIILFFRIRLEEKALTKFNRYKEVF